MALILDAGALIAFEAANPRVVAMLRDAHERALPVLTTAGATAQVWRNRSQQVQLTRLLRGVDELPIDEVRSPRIGAILALANISNVVDASIIEISSDGDEILSSDPSDLARLAEAAGRRVFIIPVST